MTYTEEEYRADMEEAYKAFPWLLRPLVRFGVWLVELEQGSPGKPGLRNP